MRRLRFVLRSSGYSSCVLELHNVSYSVVLFRDVRVSGSRVYSTILR